MLRGIILAAVLAAPAAAQDVGGQGFVEDGPIVAIYGADRAGPGDTCRRSGLARMRFTFADPEGVAYAAVHIGAVAVRPAVSDRAETWLWLPDYARPERKYRWRYEDPAATRDARTLPVAVEVVAGAGPLEVTLIGKDGSGDMITSELEVVPALCR